MRKTKLLTKLFLLLGVMAFAFTTQAQSAKTVKLDLEGVKKHQASKNTQATNLTLKRTDKTNGETPTTAKLKFKNNQATMKQATTGSHEQTSVKPAHTETEKQQLRAAEIQLTKQRAEEKLKKEQEQNRQN